MASTSSSSTPPRTITYHVFLSFRGSDTRKTFVDHLYNQLDQKGIRTFRDDKGLEKGQRIEELLQIIKESQFAIVVFSQDYASAKWCLEEIATIMECQPQYGKGNVIPIFYDVEPSVVRNQTESFAESFKRHEEKENTEKLKRWKKALKDAGEISGYHLQNDFNGFHATCVETVTNDIFTRVNRSIQASSTVLENFVGLETRVDYIGKLLTQEPDDVQFIGIWGMGGIGKTTIAMVVLKKFSSEFDGACFLKDVKEHKITELQETLLKTILKVEKMEIRDEIDGMVKIEQWLQGKKVLIVLDDIDEREQLENLVGCREWFGRGSRVIITTRDVGVLRSHRVHNKYKYIYEVHALEHQKAIQLFSCYAFQSKIPATGFERLSGLIVHYCQGLLLALKVLGSSLSEIEAVDVWENTLEELKRSPRDNIHGKLKISFDRLNSINKEAFLHIACFFRYHKEEHVKDVLKSCNLLPSLGLRLLIEKSLISVLESGRIEMHDLIQEMGWHIAREETPRSRVWEFKEVDDVLSSEMDPKHIKSIAFPYTCGFRWQNNENIRIAFEGLKILIGKRSYNEEDNNFDLVVNKGNYDLPSSLELIHFPDYPFPSLPTTTFHPSGMDDNSVELLVISLRRCSIENCSITKELNKLTYLNLNSSYSLLETPNFNMMPNLEKLYLSRCQELVEIHSSVGRLEKLVLLDLSYCFNLKKLPKFECLEKLVLLDLSYCRKLKKLPKFIRVSSLQFLKLEHCSELENFPEIQTNMPRVLELNLESIRIRELPSSFGRLRGLTELRLYSCDYLVRLCDELCELESLKILKLSCCRQLESLPEKLGNLSKLKELHVHATAIFQLPSSITQLSSLECLDWGYNMEYDKDSLKFVPNVSGLCSLKRLLLLRFETIDKGLPSDLGLCLISLEYLNLRESNFVDLPESFSQLPHLQYLDIRGCKKLEQLPKLPKSIGELYADSRFASRESINELAECLELQSVAFSREDDTEDDTEDDVYQYQWPEDSLAKMCIHFPVHRNTPFSVSHPIYSPSDDEDSFYSPPHDENPISPTEANVLRLFQYRCYQSNGISIDLNSSWYCESFVGFAVYFLSPICYPFAVHFSSSRYNYIWGPHSNKDIDGVEHCTVIAKLSHKYNENKFLKKECVIVKSSYRDEGVEGDKCFAYIPFSSLWPAESSLTPNNFSRFEVKIMNLKGTADWGCSLLYKRKKRSAIWDGSLPRCTTDIGPFRKWKYLNLNGKNFVQLPKDISRLRRLKYLDISGCRRLRELPELPTTIRELYAPYSKSLASESNIAELAIKYSKLYSVSVAYPIRHNFRAYVVTRELAKKFIPITQPFLNRNTSFAVTYPLDPDDYNIYRCFKYPQQLVPDQYWEKISISLDPNWYNHSFMGFVVCFLIPNIVTWESNPNIHPFSHCELITKLMHKDNGNEPPLQTNCKIGRLYDEEVDYSKDDLVCFVYIPFSRLWPKSKAITDNTTPNNYLVLEATIQDLEFSSSNWGCDLLYADDESLSEAIRKKREVGSSESDPLDVDEDEDKDNEDKDEDDDEDEDEGEGEDEDEDGGSEHTEDNGGYDARADDNNPAGHGVDIAISEHNDSGPNRTKPWEFTEIVDQVQCRMVSVPECSDTKVVRLLYTNSGVGILALSSNGIQKLWKCPNEQNPTEKATANSAPQYWQPNSGLLMINDVGIDLEELEEVYPCIDLSKNDSYIVSAVSADDEEVSFLDIMTFEVLATFRPPSTPTFLVFYPCDHNIIAIGMHDGTIVIYNVRLKKAKIRLIKGHHEDITGLVFSTTGSNILVSSSADAQVCVWNIVGRRQNRRSVHIQSPDGEVYSSDTHVMFHTVQLHLLLVTHETQLAIYDTSNMERKRQWIPQGCLSAPISFATYSCNSQLVYASFIDGNIGVLDADNLTLRCCIVPSAYLSQPLLNSEDVVYAVVIAAHPQKPNQLAIGLTDGSIKVIEPLESEGEWGISPPIDIEILNGKEGEDDEGRGKSLDAGQGIEVGMSKHIDSVNEKEKEREDEQRKKDLLNNNDKTLNLPTDNKKTKDQSGDLSATGTRTPIVNDDALQQLGDNCKYLVSLLTAIPLDKDYIDVEIDESIFHHKNMKYIFVMMNDIKDLLMMSWLDVSIIQVFILFLNRLCNDFEVKSIGFACPTQISFDMLKRHVPTVTSYFIRVMELNIDKQFILAPYHQDSHWILLVISIRKKSVYVLDPLPCNRDIDLVKASLNLAFRSIPKDGRSKSFNWIQCKCPIQPGHVECGYYVMRYMLDIVTKYSSVDRLDAAFQSNTAYSIDDINEIREQWAKYFFSQCV